MTAVDTKVGTVRKVLRFGQPVQIVAHAGSRADQRPFLNWLIAGEPEDDKPELSEGFGALVLRKSGIFAYNAFLESMPVDSDCAAMGSGYEIALGAMHAGATPREAVKIACDLNVYTGPPVVVESL